MENIKSLLLFIVTVILISPGCTYPGIHTLEEIRSGFLEPPQEARPRALWDWVDGNVQMEEITREMEEAVRMGLGGFDIWDVRSVVDEANIENHGLRDQMRGDLRWMAAMQARVARMIARDRNHASIIFWSLGNESSSDVRFKNLTEFIHEIDPSRPVHHEQDHRGEYADVFSMMYPTPDNLEAIINGVSPLLSMQFISSPESIIDCMMRREL